MTYQQEEDPWVDDQNDGETAGSSPHRIKISKLLSVRILQVEENIDWYLTIEALKNIEAFGEDIAL